MENRIAVIECAECGHRWVELSGERDCCLICGSRNMKKPLYIRQVRDAYRKLSPEDKDYSARLPVLEKLYFEISPLVLERAKEVFDKVSQIYEKGDRSDRVLSRLIFCFFAFNELGMNDATFSCGHLVGIGYAERAEKVEVVSERDLCDFGRALQWFALTDQLECVAMTNLRMGIMAAHAVTEDTKQYRRLLQIAYKHLGLAQEYYRQHSQQKLIDYIDRDLENVVRILAGATVGSGYVEGAEIQARAIREMGLEISKAIKEAGEYIGLSLVEAAEEISEGMLAYGETMSKAIADHGARVEHGLGDVAKSVGIGFGGLSTSVRLGLGQVSHTLVRLGDKAEESLEKLGFEVRGGLVQASKNIREEMGSLGNKVALGMIGGGAIGGLLTGGAIHQLGTTVTSSLATATNTLADATKWSGEVQAGPQKVLISEGLDAASRMLRA